MTGDAEAPRTLVDRTLDDTAAIALLIAETRALVTEAFVRASADGRGHSVTDRLVMVGSSLGDADAELDELIAELTGVSS